MIRLQESGIEAPWGIWARDGGVAMQNAASWVWHAGGDFLSADGKQVLFDQPEAIEGFVAHLKLCRYLPPGVKSIDARHFDGRAVFAQRQAAVLMGLCGWYPYRLGLEEIPDAADRLGMAVPPRTGLCGRI